MSRNLVQETTAAAVDGIAEKGTVPITVATPGWGSSGWYSPQVLENAVQTQVFSAGLHLYMDHPGETERYDRPERSVRDLVGTLTEDATWDPQRGIVAEAKIFGPYRDLFRDEDFVNAIGVSLRASADTTIGEAEGRKGTIITELVEAQSVDFVTRAGRGGRVMAALESARTAVREATASDTREALHAAVKAAHGTEDGWVWVRDFDPDTTVVYFDVEDADETHTYRQTYELTDGTATLTGEPTEVRATTTYVPTGADDGAPTDVPAPAGQSTATESEETNMATIQIEEAELGRLRQDSERVQSLESERDTYRAERDALIRESHARRVIDTQAREAGVTFTALEERGLLAGLPATDTGALDEDAYTQSVKEAAATKAETSGRGTVTGFGDVVTESSDAAADLEAYDKAFSYDAPKGA